MDIKSIRRKCVHFNGVLSRCSQKARDDHVSHVTLKKKLQQTVNYSSTLTSIAVCCQKKSLKIKITYDIHTVTYKLLSRPTCSKSLVT